MKKYLLTLALSIIGFIGFSSANYTITSVGYDYNPDSITLTSDFDFSTSILDYSCSHDECGIYIVNENFTKNCMILFEGDNIVFDESNICSFNNGEVVLFVPESSLFDSITFGESSAGESGGSGFPILTGGTDNFGGIITSLSSTLSEFIPYLVYVGLGILGAIIGFVAIKRLMNRIRAKVFGTFSGGRRR